MNFKKIGLNNNLIIFLQRKFCSFRQKINSFEFSPPNSKAVFLNPCVLQKPCVDDFSPCDLASKLMNQSCSGEKTIEESNLKSI